MNIFAEKKTSSVDIYISKTPRNIIYKRKNGGSHTNFKQLKKQMAMSNAKMFVEYKFTKDFQGMIKNY